MYQPMEERGPQSGTAIVSTMSISTLNLHWAAITLENAHSATGAWR